MGGVVLAPGGWRFTDDLCHDIGTTKTDLGRGREIKMTALTAAWRACSRAAAGGSPARAKGRPHLPESLRDRTRPEFWSGAIVTSTLWVILFIYAAAQSFGR
jgi:hypothetical protein